MSEFNVIKSLYEDGYRCIYYDISQGNPKIYLKNFDSEHSQVVELSDESQFSEFKSYIDELK